MMRTWLPIWLLGTLAIAGGPAEVRAQPAPAPATSTAKAKIAKQYVDAGLAAQKKGDYDAAISSYRKAYELVPHPVLIFDIAQATRLAGRADEALDLYEQYLAADPNGPKAQTARDIVADLRARKAEEARKAEAARQRDAPKDEVRTDEARKGVVQRDDARKDDARKDDARKDDARKDDARKDVVQRADPEATSRPLHNGEPERSERASAIGASGTTPALVSASAREASPGRGLRLWGIAAGGAGVIGLGVGIGFAVHGRTLSSEVERTYDPEKEKAGNRANTVAWISSVTGGALVVAGAALYWWGHVQERHAEGVAIAPLVSDHLAGLAVVGTLP